MYLKKLQRYRAVRVLVSFGEDVVDARAGTSPAVARALALLMSDFKKS